MKNVFKFFVPMAVAVIAFASCQQEQYNSKNTLQITVSAIPDEIKTDPVSAPVSEDVKTYISENKIYWGTGEYMKIGVHGEGAESTDWANSSDATADTWNGEYQNAYFTFSVSTGANSPYTYYGLYPASAAVANSNTNPASYKVNLPSTQNATAVSYDPKGYILVAQPEGEKTAANANWNAFFRRATALNKVTLKNIPNGVSIKRVTITAPAGKYLAGGRHIDLTSGLSGDIYSGGGRTETVEVKYATALSGSGEGTWNADIWFTSWNVEVAESETLTIVAYTTNQKSYTKEITVPSGRTIKFQEGCLNTLGAKMNEGTVIGDVTELEEGDYVVLAKDGDNYYALKAEKEDSKERLLSVAYEGSIDSYFGDADIIWSLTKSGDSFIFENDNKYLGYKGSSNESYWLEADENWTTTNYLLDVTAQETAGLYHVTLHSNSEKYLSKNSSGAFFAFYGNTSQKADIVFVPATEDTRTPVTLTFAESSLALTKGSTEYNNFAGQDVTASPDVTAITDNLNWSYTNTDGVIDETNSSDYAIALSGETGTATVTVSFAGDQTYRAATASYTITVSDAGGPEYVLVSAANDVVAGDYIITWDNSYYLPSGSTSGTNPAVGTGITVANNKITNTVTSDMVWTFTGDNTNGFTISDGTNILHSTNAAQGISITTNSTRKWTASVDGTYGMLLRGDDGGTRNLAVYNSGSWRYYATGNSYSGTLRLYKLDDSNVTPTVATPTISISGSDVSIACATDGATIYYTVDGTAPTTSSSVYSTAISISGNQQKTIKALATKSGYDNSEVASKTYYAITISSTSDGTVTAVPFAAEGDEINLTVTPESGYELATLVYNDGSNHDIKAAKSFTMPASPVTVSATFAVESVSYDFETVAELNALVTSTSATYNGYLTNAVVSFVPATNTAIVKDATGSVMFYKSGHGLLQGQTYTGAIEVTAVKYNSLYSEITAWNATFTGSQTAVSPQSVSLADLTGHYDDFQNAYVSVSGLTVVSTSTSNNKINVNVTDGTNTYVVYDNTGSTTCGAGDIITAVGTITKYSTTEEIKVWAAADITVTGTAPKAITFSQPTGAAGTAGCSFTVTVGGSPITSGNTVASGATVTLTATEGTDYEFSSWTVNGATLADASVNPASFTMGTSAVSISANFTSTGGNQQTPTLQYTLDGTVTASGNAYATASTVTQNNIGWMVVGNTEMNPWRIGGKSITNEDRAIYSTTAISANITQINVSSGATASSLTVNSLTISVHSSASDAENGTNAIATKTVTSGIASSTVTFDKADNTSWAGKYYRIVYNVTRSSSSGNGYITFNNATFYGTN